MPPTSMPTIVVNQLGYLPSRSKVAIVKLADERRLRGWSIERVHDGETVYKAAFDDVVTDPLTSHRLYPIHFDDFTATGRYRIRSADGVSAEFTIGASTYDDALYTLLRSYYLQRCGVPIQDAATGMDRWVCHTEDGIMAHDDRARNEGARVDGIGGWHDAGDYGKYVSTTAVVAIEILTAYERYPGMLDALELDIPESGDQTPDTLDEMAVGLDWMLKMQREDGAVYRKLSGKEWPPLVEPATDSQPRFLYGISTPETAKAAAAWALGSRVFRGHDRARSERYLHAARRAWSFLKTEPEQKIDQHEGDNSGSGPYTASATDSESALRYDWDDRLAAAIELFLTTGNEVYWDWAKPHVLEAPINLFEWKDPSALGLLKILWHPGFAEKESIRATVRKRLLARADAAVERTLANGYRIANHHFVWGSNKMTAAEGTLLAYAYGETADPKYLDAATWQVDYLLGRNAFDKSFVTGLGANPVAHNSHIYVRASGVDVPGLLVGGPNEMAQAGIAPAGLGPLSYADDARSYATNEYAIDYNSSLITLLVETLCANEDVRNASGARCRAL